ncbi:MAG: hypothetical protein K2Q12_01630 [Rickettsiales bacterium]|nr:hypothetical protein [Rickettsiales bacterium]
MSTDAHTPDLFTARRWLEQTFGSQNVGSGTLLIGDEPNFSIATDRLPIGKVSQPPDDIVRMFTQDVGIHAARYPYGVVGEHDGSIFVPAQSLVENLARAAEVFESPLQLGEAKIASFPQAPKTVIEGGCVPATPTQTPNNVINFAERAARRAKAQPGGIQP